MSKTEEWGLDVTIDELTILQDLLDDASFMVSGNEDTDWYKLNVNSLARKINELLDEIVA